jgi:hypothetical protein
MTRCNRLYIVNRNIRKWEQFLKIDNWYQNNLYIFLHLILRLFNDAFSSAVFTQRRMRGILIENDELSS